MDYDKLKAELIAYSKKIGIDKIGFATADPFAELKLRLYRQRTLVYQSGFEEPDIEKRTEPERLLPGAKSIIAIALAYPAKLKKTSGKQAGRAPRQFFPLVMGKGLS